LVALGLTLFSTPLFAQAIPPLEHFQCYVVLRHEPGVSVRVALLDQFNDPEEVEVVRARRFCNPVGKFHRNQQFPIADERQHLTFYATFPQSSPVRFVALSNQFNPPGVAQQVWVLREAVSLAVPTQKLPHDRPVMNHYRCYAASGPQTFEQVGLIDQFLPFGARFVLNPVLFCNPVRKTRLDTGEVSPVLDPDQHLACYSTTRVAFQTTRQIVNQFGQFAIAVGPPDTLCVPTRKIAFVTIPDAPAGTGGADLDIDR
jgi:hypothetical protein